MCCTNVSKTCVGLSLLEIIFTMAEMLCLLSVLSSDFFRQRNIKVHSQPGFLRNKNSRHIASIPVKNSAQMDSFFRSITVIESLPQVITYNMFTSVCQSFCSQGLGYLIKKKSISSHCRLKILTLFSN